MSIQGGIWNRDGEPVTQETLVTLKDLVSNQYFDRNMYHAVGNLGILYCAFDVIPESRSERQPYHCRSGDLITWDGRLDNREELIAALDISPVATDVEILAAAFAQWGTQAFARLLGDWATSIWCTRDNKLILARDYAGVRHLFYYSRKNSIAWCSDLAALALHHRKLSLNEAFVAGFLVHWPEADLTPYHEIHSVPPGAFVVVDESGQIRKHFFWHFDLSHKTIYRTDKEYEEHFRWLFRQSVKHRLRTDSPVLAELSGGLDSSSIVCQADEILTRGEAEAPRLDTLSCYDADEPDEEDIHYFGEVERKRGRCGHHVALHGLGDTLDLQLESFAAMPGFGVREELKRARQMILEEGGYRVVLSGTGGDEVLGQTLDPRIILSELLHEFRLNQFGKEIVEWSLATRRPLWFLLRDILLLHLPTQFQPRLSAADPGESWLNRRFAAEHNLDPNSLPARIGHWFWPPTARDSLQTIRILANQMNLTPPTRRDIRYPYLDRKLVEFLMSIPREQLRRPDGTRSLMRRALNGLVPNRILTRQTKSGMARCIIITLEKHWANLQPVLCSLLIAEAGYVDQNRFVHALTQLKNGHLSPHFFRVLRALSLELWLRRAMTKGVIVTSPDSGVPHGDRVAKSAV